MPVETDADRATFVNADEFGAVGIYTAAAGGAPATLNGVFDYPSGRAVVFEQVEAVDARPTFWCRSEDLPIGAAGGDADDTLTIDATVYKVASLDPDGQGMTLVTLRAP